MTFGERVLALRTEKGKLILNPENPSCEPLVYIGDELNYIRILGKAVYFMSAVE